MTDLTGTWALVRLALRVDRVRLPLWVGTMAAFPPLVQAPALEGLYPTLAGREHFVRDIAGNATFRMLYGEVPSPSVGGLTAWRASFLLVTVGLAAALTVIRHSRADEQTGRTELVCATGVGRRAPLAAALTVAIGASALVGAITAIGMAAEGRGVAGSVAYGAQLLGAGMVFAGVAAVAAQLAEGAGSARAIAVTAVAGSYLVRGSADVQSDGGLSWLSWSSPLGWLHRLEPYGQERWELLLLPVALTLLLVGGAFALANRRDLGSGVLATRLGPPTASASFRSPLALAWRLQRSSLLGWAVGLGLVGAVLGGAATGAAELLDDSPGLREVFERLGGAQVLTDAFLAAVFGLVGLMAAAQAVQAALRLRTEEEAGRAEPLLVATVGRRRWTASHLVFVALAPGVSLVVAGLAGAVTFGLGAHDLTGQLGPVLRAALVQLPAVWVVAAVAVALFGLLPRWSATAWTALAACFLLGQVGAILDLPQGILDLSPFTHVPALPGHALALPVVLLTAVAAGLTAWGVGAFARRDVG